MLFTSIEFVLLLLLTFLVYYLPWIRKIQIEVLIISSLFFYAYNNPNLLLLLIFSISINSIFSYFVLYGPFAYKKINATIGVVLNLSILLFFKYGPLFASTFLQKNTSIEQFLIHIPLPIGISFFTFQGISLMVDVYKGKKNNANQIIPRSFLKHAKNIFLFKGFFPQLISGPIVKAHDFLPQITTKYFYEIDWKSASKNLITGYFLKMVVADNLKEYTFWMNFNYFEVMSSIDLLAMIYAYSIQIFADFSGYSLIAIGLAKLFGYHLPKNFNFPYIAQSFSDFWQRWHISLSSFLKEYLYLPLGGNKNGKTRTYIHLMIVMTLGGLWHGATWNFAIWGIFHGVALAIERFISNHIKIKSNLLLVITKSTIVFSYVSLGWLLFKFDEIVLVKNYIIAIYTNSNFFSYAQNLISIFLYSMPVVFFHIFYLLNKNRKYNVVFNKFSFLFYAGMTYLIIVNSGSSEEFIYFQF